MDINTLIKICNFKVLSEGENRQIDGVFCGDLLSWAIGRAKEGDAWCTVMGNVNTVAVATLADCACVILCHDSIADEAMVQRARQQNLYLLATNLPEYETCVLLNSTLKK